MNTPRMRPTGLSALALFATLLGSGVGRAQQVSAERIYEAPAALREGLNSNYRGVRRDVPMTDSIRRAFAANTRNFSGRPGPNYWQLRTDFQIAARLDTDTQTIHGSETITVHNTSPDELSSLALRLDHNLFCFGVPRGSSVPAEMTEGMVVTRLAIDGVAIDLRAAPRRRQMPSAGNSVSGLQATVARIRLAKPIAAGAKAELAIDWHTKLPGGDAGRGHRMTMRWDDTLYQPTQWFPRLCKYDDMYGWVTSPYLGPAEFYNNYGTFDVALDLPGGWLCSATGVLQNADEVLSDKVRERLSLVLESDEERTIVGEEDRGAGAATAVGERLTWRFHADMVNDFVWATARDYVWHATRATIPERGPIPIHMLYLPEHKNLYARAGAITRHALEFYSDLWVPYAFPQLTLQDGPSAGMEYPMVINSNQGAADHEAAHQWWPMMVGTNETMYGWMDEGFNTYMNILSDAHRRGRTAKLDGRAQAYGQRFGNEAEPPMMWSANYAGPEYGFQTYMKAPMMLAMLGGMVGDQLVQDAMKEYARVWAFKHPSPWDFVFFMSDQLKMDLGWFWYYWLWTTDSVDGSIQSVKARGVETVVTIKQSGQMPSPVVLDVLLSDREQGGVSIQDAALMTDGTQRVTYGAHVWFDGSNTFDVVLPCSIDRIERLTLDPRGRFPDSDKSDNVWPRK